MAVFAGIVSKTEFKGIEWKILNNKTGVLTAPKSLKPGVSNPQPKMAMNVAQHTLVNLLKIFVLADQFSLVFVYVMCGPRQLFFFHCSPETPKGWTPLGGFTKKLKIVAI